MVKVQKIFIVFLLMTGIYYVYSQNIIYQYDHLNRLTQIEYEDGTTIEYTYDAVGNRLTNVIIGPHQVSEISILAGWNMLGLPLEVTDNHYLTLFPNAMINTLYSFKGTYQPETNLEIGTGYWLKFLVAETASIMGTVTDTVILNLREGWNMISGPSCGVPVNSIQDPQKILIDNTLYKFNGSYEQSTIIDPGQGYWIRAIQAGQITMVCGYEPSAGHLVKIGNTFKDFPCLEIRDSNNHKQILYFNVKLEKAEDKLMYSLPPLPPRGAFDVRFCDGYWISEKDIDSLKIQCDAFPITVNISKFNIPDGYCYLLTGFSITEEIFRYELTDVKSLIIEDSSIIELRISKDFIIPQEFIVFQNYPNPFNPTTEIKYGIPKDSKVELTVFNALGQKVKTLISANQKAGYYLVTWDGTNQAGIKLSSGIYFYMIHAEKHQGIKKMIFLK